MCTLHKPCSLKFQENITCTQLNNVSILPSYNSAFNAQRNLFSSTQSAPVITNNHLTANSSYSTHLTRNNNLPTTTGKTDDSNSKLKKLQEQIFAKEGEVAILRGQLRDARARYEIEHAKKQKDWLEKLNEKTKEMKLIQSKLEFKVHKMVF